MDCDTTGVEPDFSLVKFKELVGGGQMTIVNRTVPLALQTLGYTEEQIEQIVALRRRARDDRRRARPARGAPAGVRRRRRRARDLAHGPHQDDGRGPAVHLRRDLARPSTCPQSATVEDIADAYTQAWQLRRQGARDLPRRLKTAQALRTDAQKDAGAAADVDAQPDRRGGRRGARQGGRPRRKRMPRERQSITHKFSIGGHEGYITAGMYEDGTVGEIFLTDIGKEGSTLRGMMNSFATAISIALQYGVPLETLVQKFSYMRFEPEGITSNPEIPFAKSMPDYIMRWLASRFLDADAQEELGILTPGGPRPQSGPGRRHLGARGRHRRPGQRRDGTPPSRGADGGRRRRPTHRADRVAHRLPAGRPGHASQGLDLGPACSQCGGMMQRTGSCYTCSCCGNNTGCG